MSGRWSIWSLSWLPLMSSSSTTCWNRIDEIMLPDDDQPR
jgi:hypothetical protein